MELTQAYLKSILHYEPDTGIFTWRYRERLDFPHQKHLATWNTRFAGRIAGSDNGKGYLTAQISRVHYRCHRLAFLYMTGSMHLEEVDHINGIRNDNRWNNLRAVSRFQNMANQKRRHNNTSGVTGVSWNRKALLWEASITTAKKQFYLGGFADKDAAIATRKAAEKDHGFHPNHGRG
jgi:hypothetical protein